MGDQAATGSSKKVRRLLAGLATLTVIGGGALAAQTPAPAAASGSAIHGLGRVASVKAYWTPARMRAAVPAGASTVRSGGTTYAPRTTGLTANTVPTGTGHVRVPKNVGKLFFTDRHTDYVCSAAAIDTRSRDQVLTAAHCVHTGPHPDGGLLNTGLLAGQPRYYSNWVFVPRYANGRAPLGKWVATNRLVAQGWIKDESFAQDQGILTVARLNGKRLEDVVGGDRVALGRSRHQQGARIWGWPAESPYDGQRAWRCDGTTKATDVASPGDAGMTCGLNGGASGGPWLLKGHAGRPGTIFAVTSRITVGGSSHVVLAHPLPTSLRSLIAAAGG